MRNILRKTSALFIVFLMVFALQSCGKKVETSTEAVGEGVEADATVEAPVVEVTIDEIKAALTDVYFDFDKANLTAASHNAIARNANALGKVEGISVLLEGNCDERGSSEYNLALGDSRAQTVKQALIASGFPAGSISTISYGKERSQCTASNESCWQLNRRVHIEIR